MINWISRLGKAAIGLALSLSAASAAASLTNDPMYKVEPRVMRATAGGQSSSVVVLLTEQCDLSIAPTLADPDARGWYVYRALRRHARRTQARLRAELRARGIHYRAFWAANALVVSGNRGLVEQLAGRADVQAIESNLPSSWIEDPSLSDYSAALETAAIPEWGVSNVNAPSVWSMGFTGQGIVIGNQDTGIQWDHPALRPQYRGWNGSSADHNYNWHDAIHSGGGICGASSLLPCDDNGHGTHTTGTAAGFDGASNQIGVAPGAKWIGCRNMDRGVGAPATYMECFQFFMAPTDLSGSNPDPTKRPHVMNNSWACPTSEGCAANTLKTVVENAEAAGIFVEVSAGNAGPSCSTVGDPPAIYAAAFSTGAYDSSNTLAGFSSRGPVLVDASNRMKPDIAAPGVTVRSSLPTNNYGNLSGTSMAGPHVVGVVALLWSARPQLARDVTTTKSILEMTANPHVLLSAQTCGGIASSVIPNNSFGYGRVDALAAVNAVPLFTPTATASATATLSPSPTVTVTFTRTATATATPTSTGTITPTPLPSSTPSITATPSETPTPSQTPPPTLTPSITPTASPTPSVVSVISGRIRYYSADRPVASAVVQLAGDTNTMMATDPTGAYQFPSVPFGNWTVTPELTGTFGGAITAVDASYVLQAAIGSLTLDSMQRLAADANGNGTLTAIDASLILQLRVGLITRLPVAIACTSDWAFVPQAPGQQQIEPSASGIACQHGAIAYSALQMDIAGQDFLGILYGDVNGSWDPGAGGGGAGAASSTPTLRWGNMQPRAGQLRRLLYLEAAAPVYAFDVELRYDPARFHPTAARRIGARHALIAFNAAEPGRVRIAVASAEPIAAGTRPALAVVFESVE